MFYLRSLEVNKNKFGEENIETIDSIKQLANAVCPQVIESIGMDILPYIK